MIDGLLYRLNKDNHFTEVQLEQIKYALQLILGDISKLIILITLASLLGYRTEFLYAYITSMLLRLCIGGNHMSTYLGCLLFSLTYYSSLIVISSLLKAEYSSYLFWLTMIFITILIIIAPRISKKSGRSFKKNRFKLKAYTLMLVTVYLVIYMVKSESIYAIGPLTIILQTIQLLMMKGGSYYEVRKETKVSA